MRPFVTVAVICYAVVVLFLWLAVTYLVDRIWPATLIAFGPRWLAILPLLPLTCKVVVGAPSRPALRLLALLALSGIVLVFGFMDFRFGLDRVAGTPMLRVMSHNVGEGRVTAKAIDHLMKAERIDVAGLQECPFLGDEMTRLGWRYSYDEGLCLVSRYPFVVLDQRDRGYLWPPAANEAEAYDIETPMGRIHLLNVHLATVRAGLEALRPGKWRLGQFARNRAEVARQSHAARERIIGRLEPVLVLGDFNLPVESAIYRDNWGDLRNAFSSCGRGFGYTKFTRLFGIRIDHVLTSRHWRCANARVLSSLYGGDHAPLVVDLVIAK